MRGACSDTHTPSRRLLLQAKVRRDEEIAEKLAQDNINQVAAAKEKAEDFKREQERAAVRKARALGDDACWGRRCVGSSSAIETAPAHSRS